MTDERRFEELLSEFKRVGVDLDSFPAGVHCRPEGHGASASLLKVSGVGTVKATRYGEIFLDVIRAHCHEHNLAEKPRPDGRAARAEVPASTAHSSTSTVSRTSEVGEAYNNGESIQELMRLYGVTLGTVLEHLARYAMDGTLLRAGEDLPALSRLRQRHSYSCHPFSKSPVSSSSSERFQCASA